MTQYFIQGKGWRFNFVFNGKRYTKAWFDTKLDAQKEELLLRERLKADEMSFGLLVECRLTYMENKAPEYSKQYYNDFVYQSKYWLKDWEDVKCSDITSKMVQEFILKRAKASPSAANRSLRLLKSLFNWAISAKYITVNPVDGIEMIPVDNKSKYIPPMEDIEKVFSAATPGEADFLWAIREMFGRCKEICQMEWDHVNFESNYVTLFKRERKSGELTHRNIPMTQRLRETLLRRYEARDRSKPWVFWHQYYSRSRKETIEGPYVHRNKLMPRLCDTAQVRRFGYHGLREACILTLFEAIAIARSSKEGVPQMGNKNCPPGVRPDIFEVINFYEAYISGKTNS